MDLTKLHNPYDFANPISDEDLFVGRKREMDDIKYYLNHAMIAPRPINVALLGPRASGKTSILNMVQLEANRRGFCTVRIDLDEDDATSQLGFFYKIFDALFTSACEIGIFEGKGGKTYDTYLDIVNSYNIPDDKTFCPFIFPIQYAIAIGSGNERALLSEQNYKSDIAKIRSELKCPIILLFDEGNVLVHSRVHLEKLRNTFMNTPGFMLIMTGTPDIFPLMDDVFSPIVRQFKKILVGDFKDEEDTEKCIKEPLKKIGVDPNKMFDFEAEKEEIHNITGGRPYEIQLICHIMYRRVEDKRTAKMELDLGVLEDVRNELEMSQEMATRPILNTIRALKKSRLPALNLLCACDGHATFEQIWEIEYISNGDEYWTKDLLEKEVDFFINANVLEGRESVETIGFRMHPTREILKFAGDDFDKIYTKYYAREYGVPLLFKDLSLEEFWFERLETFVRGIGSLTSIQALSPFDSSMQPYSIFTELLTITGGESDEYGFTGRGPNPNKLYFLMLNYRRKKFIPLIRVGINTPWMNFLSWHYATDPKNSGSIDTCLTALKEWSERASDCGAKLVIEREEIKVIPLEELAQKIESTSNKAFRLFLSMQHNVIMRVEYINKRNMKEALLHANLAYRYELDPPLWDMANDLGYIFMAAGEFAKARGLLELAVKKCDRPINCALCNYNLGLLDAKEKKYKSALAKIELSIKQAKNVKKPRRQMGCLFYPKVANGELQFKERRYPDLFLTAKKAKKALQSILNSECKLGTL